MRRCFLNHPPQYFQRIYIDKIWHLTPPMYSTDQLIVNKLIQTKIKPTTQNVIQILFYRFTRNINPMIPDISSGIKNINSLLMLGSTSTVYSVTKIDEDMKALQ